ncbi:TetR/AcrR family transcriptional regulator [Solimonas terrae]|uniref:TetR/AcrR family transcriptional regulator n=1 Tax=Solimonas terrae TaxID=1396819 RepID=A0A6M2BWM6_9GAMM|nr:TetR/AcrR family transcriptional regulator [Solimonas terrae]NGY06996.1 TetR/AcrR family transcriptional regulator [Solimonas terrae]
MTPEARRAQIIEVAREVFSKAGAGRTRMRDVAKAAGVTEQLLYQHFDSREELFKLSVLDPLEEIVERLAARLRALVKRTPSDLEMLHRQLHEAFLDNVIAMIPLLAAAQFSDPEKGPQYFSGHLIPRIRRSVVGLVQRLTGIAPRSVAMEVAMRALLGAHFGIALETVLSRARLDVDRTAERLSSLFGPGLARAHLDNISTATRKGAVRRRAPAAAAGGRKRLRRAEREDAILAAAREVFLQHGLAGARSKTIAERAAITEAFMFRLFATKEEIYEAAVLVPVTLGLTELAEGASQIVDGETDAAFLERLNRIASAFFSEYGRLCIVALFAELGEGQKFYRRSVAPKLVRLRTILGERFDVGEDPDGAEILRRVITGANWGLSFGPRWPRHDPDDIVAILTRLFTAGMQVQVRA